MPRLSAPLALGGLSLVAARFVAARAEAPSIAAAGLLAGGVLALTSIAARRCANAVAGLSLVAALVVIWMSSESPRWPAMVAVLLASAVALVVAERFAANAAIELSSLLALSTAAQWIVRGAPIWTARFDGGALTALVAAPAIAALGLAVIGRREPGAVGPFALAAFAGGPGWTLGSIAALATAAALSHFRVRWLPFAAPLLVAVPALGNEPVGIVVPLALAAGAALIDRPTAAAAARAALAVAAFVVLIVGSPPWSRSAPLASGFAAALDSPFARYQVLRLELATHLTPAVPRYEETLSGAEAVRAVVVDSFLSNSLELPCGAPVARIVVEGAAGERFERVLFAGGDSGDWASRRPDVAPRLACPPPEPFALWLPAGERFFAARFRSRIEVDSVASPERILVERAQELPASVGVTLFGVALER